MAVAYYPALSNTIKVTRSPQETKEHRRSFCGARLSENIAHLMAGMQSPVQRFR